MLDEVVGAEVPGDTLAALQLLRAQFPQLPGRPVAPLVLRSQVYSVVRDRTAVDRELDELRCGSLRTACAVVHLLVLCQCQTALFNLECG